MIRKTFAMFATAALLATSGLEAQRIVGVTQLAPTVVVQEFSGNCDYKRCVPTGFETQVARHAGGSAYDGRIKATWITNGLSLAAVDPWMGNCDYICRPQSIPLPPDPTTRHYATGLAYVESGSLTSPQSPGWLFASYNSGWIARMDVRDCVVRARFCQIQLPTGAVMSGLATDDVNRRLFIAVVLSNGSNLIYVSDLDNNFCSPTCRTIPGDCTTNTPLGPITGLAFDPCKETLFATDGLLTARYAVASAPRCDLRVVGCCKRNGDAYTGLCYLPDRDVRSIGRSCTVRSCETCPTMRAELFGDPVLGNPLFGLALRDAPNQSSTAILAAGVGACSPTGVNIGFCSPLRVALPPSVNFFPLSPMSTLGCTRNITLPFAVPLNQGLCGLQISFQWLVVCQGNPTGHGMTNCVDFRFSGT